MKFLNEAHGMVTDEGKEWSTLVDLIVQFMFDIENGMPNDPFYEDDGYQLTDKKLRSWYRFTFNKQLPENTIPEWVDSFCIIFKEQLYAAGTFVFSESEMRNGKLHCVFKVNNTLNNPSPDSFYYVLMHEFKHAYDKWLKETKKLHMPIYDYDSVYQQVLMPVLFNNRGKKFSSIYKQYDQTTVTLVNDIYTNTELMVMSYLWSLYYSNKNEFSAYSEEYARSVAKSGEDANITDFAVYRKYLSYLLFWQRFLQETNYSVRKEVFNEIKKLMKMDNTVNSTTFWTDTVKNFTNVFNLQVKRLQSIYSRAKV